MANGNTKGQVDRAGTYAGLATGTGLAAWIIALPEATNSKIMYLALLAVGGFAAAIVKVILSLFADQLKKHGEVLEQVSTAMAVQSEAAHSELAVARATKEAIDKTCSTVAELAKGEAVHAEATHGDHKAIISNLVQVTEYLRVANSSPKVKKVK